MKEAAKRTTDTAVSISAAELIERAQRGDEAAFQALFEENKQRVYSLCLRMTQNAADAEDLSQDAFLKAFRKIGTFRSQSAFSTWLYRLTVNEVLMHLRKKRLTEVPLDAVEASQDHSRARAFGSDDPRLTGAIDRIHLNKAVALLAPGMRTALTLFDLEGYGHQEIAEITNRSVGCSKSQLHKARKKLRSLLRHQTEQRLVSVDKGVCFPIPSKAGP